MQKTIKYTKLFGEFSSFVGVNLDKLTDDYEIKLLNLILSNFDAIVECGTAHGKRTMLLKDLIDKYGEKAESKLPSLREDVAEKKFSFKKLKLLKVKNFRGFLHQEEFLFDKQYTFIYGPNGSGKSSFCEALEFTMLGYIDEAISKSIEINKYVRNVYGKDAYVVKLIGLSEDGKDVEISKNAELFHFCFLEKNRIEGFGRIASHTPSNKESLLAKLFGLVEFNNFVSNFTAKEKIVDKIDVVGIKAKALQEKYVQLEQVKRNIADKQSMLNKLKGEEEELVKQGLYEVKTLVELEAKLNEDQKKIEGALIVSVAEKYEVVTTADIKSRMELVDRSLEEFNGVERNYSESKDKVQFKKLYEALVELKNIAKDRCPACKTPFKDTVENPFENAEGSLRELYEVAYLEKRRIEKFGELKKELFELSKVVGKRREVEAKVFCAEYTPQLDFNIKYGVDDNSLMISSYNDFAGTFKKCEQVCDGSDLGEKKYRNIIRENEDKILTYNAKINSENKAKENLIEERKKIDRLLDDVKRIKNAEKLHLEDIKSNEMQIFRFDKENATLIEDVNKEKVLVERNIKYVKAYGSLLDKLETYKDELPSKFLSGLNDLTLEIYNDINQHDLKFEKLARLTLPSSKDDDIVICFQNEPDIKHDALRILSEGHLRCLGLSILLAKNIQEKCPVIVFDDVVNAIDDDHRGGIKELIFNSQHFKDKQIILTTHGEMFARELETKLDSATHEKLVNKFSFVQDKDERRLRVRRTNFHYLSKAKGHARVSEKKEALYNCRCALENIINVFWKKIGKKYMVNFSVIMRSPNASPDLMSVVNAARECLKKNGLSETFSDISGVFDFLIGLKTAKNEAWNYLNKGTHEGEEGAMEFDSLLVDSIIGKLELLEEKVKSMKV